MSTALGTDNGAATGSGANAGKGIAATTVAAPAEVYHPTAGTVARGAIVVGRRHRGGTRPATGPTTHRQSNSATQIPTEISAAPPLKIGGGDMGQYTIHPVCDDTQSYNLHG
ncbi:hypothetical protein ACLOJK_018706 [Asimina triloba]